MSDFQAERLESMSPRGSLELIKQPDGDMIVVVRQCNLDGIVTDMASVEFCTPFSGAGGSPKTHRALMMLMVAMAEDNLDDRSSARRPEFVDLALQKSISEWGIEMRKAEAEYAELRKRFEREQEPQP